MYTFLRKHPSQSLSPFSILFIESPELHSALFLSPKSLSKHIHLHTNTITSASREKWNNTIYIAGVVFDGKNVLLVCSFVFSLRCLGPLEYRLFKKKLTTSILMTAYYKSIIIFWRKRAFFTFSHLVHINRRSNIFFTYTHIQPVQELWSVEVLRKAIFNWLR